MWIGSAVRQAALLAELGRGALTMDNQTSTVGVWTFFSVGVWTFVERFDT